MKIDFLVTPFEFITPTTFERVIVIFDSLFDSEWTAFIRPSTVGAGLGDDVLFGHLNLGGWWI
jgi:hypothetical protein